MSAVAKVQAEAPEIIVEMKGDIITVETEKALRLFQSADALEAFFTQIDEKILSFPTAVETKKQRDAIRSTAASMSKLKTHIDGVGADIVEEKRKEVREVDGIRKQIRDALDEKRITLRKPLTDYEEAEEARKAKHQDAINLARKLGQVALGETVADIQARIDKLPSNDFSTYEEFEDEARLTVNAAFQLLVAAKTNVQNADAERVRFAEERRQFEAQREQERLRQEAEAKVRAERDAAEAAERNRIAAEQEAIRQKTLAEEAARQKVIAEERAAMDRERAEIAAEKQRLADEQAKAAEQAAAAEAERVRKADAEREAAERKLKLDVMNAEAAQREANEAELEANSRNSPLADEPATSMRDNIVFDVIALLEGGVMTKIEVAEAIADALIAGRIRHILVDA